MHDVCEKDERGDNHERARDLALRADGGGAALVGGLNTSLYNFTPTQNTFSVGLRWDAMTNVAVKAQYDRIKTGEQSILVDANYATTEVCWPGVPDDALDVKNEPVAETLFSIADFMDEDGDEDWWDDGEDDE